MDEIQAGDDELVVCWITPHPEQAFQGLYKSRGNCNGKHSLSACTLLQEEGCEVVRTIPLEVLLQPEEFPERQIFRQ